MVFTIFINGQVFFIAPQSRVVPPRRHKVLTETEALALVAGGDAIGVGARAEFDVSDPSRVRDPEKQTLALDFHSDRAVRNGEKIVSIVRDTALVARRESGRDSVRDLARLWGLFHPITSRVREVNELLDAWWDRGAEDHVLRVLGRYSGRGRPPSDLGTDRTVACTMDGLIREGMTAKEAARVLAGAQISGMRDGRRIANVYSERGHLYQCLVTPYRVPARELLPAPWILPAERTRRWVAWKMD